MAYLIGESGGTRSSGKTLERNGQLWRLKRTFTREFLVLADTLDEPDASVRAAVPPVGSVFEMCLCKEVAVAEVQTVIHPKSGKLTAQYRITCTYDNQVRANPLEMDPEIKWSCEFEEAPLIRDVDTGAPIQTTAGEQIPLTTQNVIPVLSVTRYVPLPFDPNIFRDYTNTINEGEFWGAPPAHALLTSIECDYADIEISDETKIKVAHVSYHIKFRFNPRTQTPWKAEPLNYGNYEKESMSTDNIVQHIDPNGRPCQTLLNESGFPLGATQDPVFLSFNQYRTANWDALGINRSQLGY